MIIKRKRRSSRCRRDERRLVLNSGTGSLLLLLLSISLLAARSSAQEQQATLSLPLDPEQQEQDKNTGVLDSFGQWIDKTLASMKQALPQQQQCDETATADERQKESEKDRRDPFPNLRQESDYQQDTETTLGSIISTVQSILRSMAGDDAGDDDNKSSSQTADSSSPLANILHMARSLASSSDTSRTRKEEMDLFFEHFQQVKQSIMRTFGSVASSIEKLHPMAIWYYLEHEDEHKNPSYKRRRHRYYKSLPTKTAMELHDALYLSHLSYAHSVEDIEKHLKDFQNDSWELIYCTVEGRPAEPAHFIAIQKEETVIEQDDDYGLLMYPWQQQAQPDRALEVLMVVRGTKELGDMLSDGLLDPISYRGAKAHAGIAKAGKWLANKHRKTLLQVLEASKHNKMRLSLIGHSLGAGAAAIVAMEFNNEHPKIEATSIGFGCPALVSLNTSQAAKDYITTVVVDSDVIPRMSGASLANMLLDVASFDWTAKALEDLQDFLLYVNASVPFELPIDKVMKWANETMETDDRPFFGKVTKERIEPVLFPPGNCVHVFRDGFGYTGTYTPCEFFQSVDVTRTLIDDHLIPPGYHRALLSLLRDTLGDFHFDFQHDLMALPV